MKYRYKIFYSVFFSLVLSLASFPSASASQVSSSLPKQVDFTSSVRLIVGQQESGAGIDAPVSEVKIYSTSSSISVTINNFGQCNGDNYDYLNPGSTTYEIFRTDTNENQTGSRRGVVSNSGNCSSDSYTMNVTHGGSKSNKLGNENYYVYIFKATMAGSSLGFNGFSLSSSGNLIGYSDRAGQKFAIKSRFNTSSPSYSNFNLYFGTECSVESNQTKDLRWFDADQNEGNQVETISFDLYDVTEGSYVIQNKTNLGGQNQSGSASVTFKPDHKYRWTWKNVSSFNGIQMEMPYDSIYFRDCPQDDWAYTSSITSVTPNSSTSPKPNATISVTARATNTGTDSGDNYDHRIRVNKGSGYLVDSTTVEHNNQSSLSGSGTRNHSAAFTVKSSSDAPHDGEICFQSRIRPKAYGDTSWTDWSSEVCVNIYNLRFNNVFNNDSVTPNPIGPSTSTGTANFTIANTGSIPAGSTGGASATMSLTASEPAGADYLNIDSVNGTNGSSGTLATINRNNSRNVQVEFTLKDNLSPGDNVCIVLTFSPSAGYSDGSSTSGSRTETACARVGEHAFLEVRNGSVWAGAGWADTGVIGGSICNDFTATDSYIRTHLDRPNDQGSFASYAGVANGSITGFDTRSVGEDYFTFANTSVPHGLYAQNNKCITDYYDYLRKSGVGVTARNNNDIELPSGQYFNDSTFTIGGGDKTVENQVVYIVDGDVNINADILYPGYTESDSSQIPFLMIVASGDITIHNQVEEINGVFISRGKIITCHIPSALTLSKCGNQLTVRGMFVAEDIEFRRTHGGILREGGPAEIFRFNPEVYLANPNFISDYEDNFSTAQTKELPPLYR